MFLTQGTSEQALVDLINQNNALPIELSSGDLYFGKVKSIASGYVSVPTVTMYNNENYEGYATFEYKRYNLTTLFGGVRPVVTDLGQGTIWRLLPLINKILGMNLQERDIIDQKIDWIGGNEQANLNFVAQPNSLAYEGNFIVKFIRVRPELAQALANTKLPVLRHVDPLDAAKKSMSMMTWGIDFSDYAKTLQVYAGFWKDTSGVQALMADLGFASFPAPARYDVELKATKDVPGANKAFANVVIQKNVVGPDYKGTAYFHFN